MLQLMVWCNVVSLRRIAVLLAQAVPGGVPLPLAMIALPEMLLFPIDVSLIISLIYSLVPLWTSANFAASGASATFLCKELKVWSEPILSLDSSFLFDELGDDLI
jgi:hypothetical protein